MNSVSCTDFESFAERLFSSELNDVFSTAFEDEFERIKTPDACTECCPEPARTPAARPKRRRYHSWWTEVEDAFVLEYHSAHGPVWRAMSLALATNTACTRSDDALRNRYDRLVCHHYEKRRGNDDFSPEVVRQRVPWTATEDQTIVKALQTWDKHRSSWNKLACTLPGRTPHAVRNRANRLCMTDQRRRILDRV